MKRWILLSVTLVPLAVQAVTYTVTIADDTHLPYGTFNATTNEGDLRGCLFQINKTGTAEAYQIAFASAIETVTLGGILPPLGLNTAPTSITIDGTLTGSTQVTIDGAGMHPGFFAYLPNAVTIKNVTIQNTVSQGGSGSGGALGAGGAIFVGQHTAMTLENVIVSSCEAAGGNGSFGRGGNYGGGGGGMCRGNGGSSDSDVGVVGGGGGFGGVGGNGSLSGGSGGGGGISPYGGTAGTTVTGKGGNGEEVGAQGGGIPGYSGGANSYDPPMQYAGGTYCGGGGGSRSLHEDNPGGGGIGGHNGEYLGSGGAGGPFGGGGAGLGGSAGDGGTYGGGGACRSYGGAGTGIGGGGGGSDYDPMYGGYGGNGAVGGGGGGGMQGGSGGVGGGNGSIDGGGGGAGFGGGIFVAEGGTLTLQGTFSINGCSVSGGTGGVAGSGNGAAVGSGLFFHTGSSTSGTCILAPSAGQTITLSNDLADDNILNVPSGHSYTAGGSGTLSLSVGGTGTTLLATSSSATHTGTTTISGLFKVNGTIPYSSLVVSSGGQLQGTGTISTAVSVESGGYVKPGNSIGTLHTGPITFHDGSIFEVEIAPTESSQLDVTGTATLAGTVNVTQDAGTYGASGQYPILSATTITGAFNPTVTGGLPGYSFRLNQQGNTLYLSYLGPSISTSTLSGNSRTLSNYLNANASYSTLVLLDGLSGEALQSALESLSPSRNAFGGYIASQNAFAFISLLGGHMDKARALHASRTTDLASLLLVDAQDKPYGRPSKPRWQGWVTGFGEAAYQSAAMQNPALHYQAGAALAGCDFIGDEAGLVGGALGYARTHFTEEGDAGHGHINSYLLSLYGYRFFGSFYIAPAMWGIFNQTQQVRHILFPGFSHHAQATLYAWQCVPHLDLGYEQAVRWGKVVPFTSLDGAFTWQRGYTEQGGSPFNTHQGAHRSAFLRSETGLKFSQEWQKGSGTFLFSEKVSYIFEKPFSVGRVQANFVGTPGSFTLFAVNQTLNLAGIGVQLAGAFGERKLTTLQLSYDGAFGAHFWSNQLALTLCRKF